MKKSKFALVIASGPGLHPNLDAKIRRIAVDLGELPRVERVHYGLAKLFIGERRFVVFTTIQGSLNPQVFAMESTPNGCELYREREEPI